MSLDPVKNFAKVTVSLGYSAGATSIVLSTGDGAKLPAPGTDGAFNLVWYNATDYPDPSDDPNKEIVRCTARSSDTLTITRAQEGTSAAAHNTSGKTYKMILAVTKKMMDDLNTSLPGTLVDNEVPAGTMNGSNLVFTLAHTPSPTSSLKIFLNGVRLKTTSGFSLSGNQITLTIAPNSGDELLADYRY